MTPLALSPEVIVVLVLVGAIVVGVAMLWFLGLLFERAVDADNRIAKGFWVLIIVGVISAYGRAVVSLLPL